MRPLDREILIRFLELAGDRLTGDWVVMGGCVLHLLGVGQRSTLDIDMAGPASAGMDQALILMEVAEELGLPAEAINQAGAFFLSRIDGWEAHIVEVHRGTTATIHIPDATLFLLSKISRLTESDLGDCIRMLEYARSHDQPVDPNRVIDAANRIARADATEGHRQRLIALLEALDTRE